MIIGFMCQGWDRIGMCNGGLHPFPAHAHYIACLVFSHAVQLRSSGVHLSHPPTPRAQTLSTRVVYSSDPKNIIMAIIILHPIGYDHPSVNRAGRSWIVGSALYLQDPPCVHPH